MCAAHGPRPPTGRRCGWTAAWSGPSCELPEIPAMEVLWRQTAMTKAPQSSSAGLIIRQREPTNLETPLDQVDSYLTPTELFYVRSHFPTPKIGLASYRLRIDGPVRNPLSLSYQQLRGVPAETRVATPEGA